MNFRFALFFFAHYGFIGLLALFAYLIGAKLTARIAYSSIAEKFSLCAGLGLGVLAHAILALGLLHLLTPAAILIMFGIISAFLVRPWKELRIVGQYLWLSTSRRSLVLYGIIGILVIPILFLPLYPPTQWDATSYHLAAAQIYANSHAVVFTPYLRFPVFPQVNEMLFTLARLVWVSLLKPDIYA